MANEMPVTRSETAPTTCARTIPPTSTSAAAGRSGISVVSSTIASPYSPAAKYSAWPKLSSPATPNSRW